MWAKNKKRSGFTIVELLIVIVVIGVLASVTLVTFNGVQNKAYATKAAAAVDAYVKMIEILRVENGAYPDTTLGDPACLGEAEYYPEISDAAAGVCAEEGEMGVTVDESLNTELRNLTSKLPDASLPPITVYGSVLRGVMYFKVNDDEAEIVYYMRGNQPCPRGEAMYVEEYDMSGCFVLLGG